MGNFFEEESCICPSDCFGVAIGLLLWFLLKPVAGLGRR